MLFVCLGDSITYGYPYGPESSWVYLTQQRVRYTLVNKGNNGDTTGEMLDRFVPDVLNLKPTDVIILGGTNDAWYELSLTEVKKNVIKMRDIAIKNSIRFHLGLPIPVNLHAQEDPYFERSIQTAPYLDSYRNWMHSYAVEKRINVIDFFTPMLGPDKTANPNYYVDTGHPNQLGYQVMATTMTNYLYNLNLI